MGQVIDNKQCMERPIVKLSKKKAARRSYTRLTDKEIEKIMDMEAEAKRRIKNLLDEFFGGDTDADGMLGNDSFDIGKFV